MNAKFRLVLCAASVCVLSCGSHHDSNDTDVSTHKKPIGGKDSTGEDTSKYLNAPTKQKFESWRARLLKHCTVSDAFDDFPTPLGKVDAKIFLEKTHSSLLLKGQGEEFLMFGLPQKESGSENSKLKITKNGEAPFEAEFKREGAQCEVTLNGEKVYTTELYSSVPINAHWYKGKEIKESVLASSLVTPLANSTSAVLRNHQFETSLFRALQSDKKSTEFLAKYFGISNDEAQITFTEGFFEPLFIASLTDQAQILPFGSAKDIHGDATVLQSLLSKPTEVPIDIKIKPPYFGTDSLSNTGDDHNWVLNARISVHHDKDGIFQYSASAIELKEPIPFDDQEALKCFQKRQSFFKTILAPAWPSLNQAIDGCSALSRNFGTALSGSKEAKAVLVDFLSHITPSRQTNYKNWDLFLKAVAKQSVKENKNLREELDPMHRVSLIENLSVMLDDMNELFKSHPRLLEERMAFTKLALTWSLAGEKVDHARLLRIFDALEVSVKPFKTSTLNLLAALGQKPFAFDENLDFALTLNAEYKDLAADVYAQAKPLTVQDWFGERFEKVLQDRIPLVTVQKWKQTLNATERFKSREDGRLVDGQGSRFMEKDHFAKLAKRAIEETWTDSEFQNLEKISQLTQVFGICNHYKSVSSRVDCHESQVYSNKAGLFLDPKFEGRYVGLSESFHRYIKELPEEMFSIRMDLEREFYRPVWKGCTNEQFTSRAKTLEALIGNLKSVKDWQKKTGFEKDIRDLLGQCR